MIEKTKGRIFVLGLPCTLSSRYSSVIFVISRSTVRDDSPKLL